MGCSTHLVDFTNPVAHETQKYLKNPDITTVVSYRRIAQHLETMAVHELIRRMGWVDKTHYHMDTSDRDFVNGIVRRRPSNFDEVETREALYGFLDAIHCLMSDLLDEMGCHEGTGDVWVVQRSIFEFQFKNQGDFRIHIWNHLHQNHLRRGAFEWDYVQGIAGYGIRSDYWVEYRIPGYVDTRLCNSPQPHLL